MSTPSPNNYPPLPKFKNKRVVGEIYATNWGIFLWSSSPTKPYCCVHCDLEFSLSGNLRRHVRTQHLEPKTKLPKHPFSAFEGTTIRGTRKVALWSPNNPDTPDLIGLNSHQERRFLCDNPQCSHDEFDQVISRVTNANQSSWCPYCSPKATLCDSTDCTSCLERSFASFSERTKKGGFKVACWSSQNEKTPREVAKSSNESFHFDCDNCPHSFTMSLNAVTRDPPRWCPYCANSSRKRCDDPMCTWCFRASFASINDLVRHPNGGKYLKISCWDTVANGGTTPRDVAKNSHETVVFFCKTCGHSFETRPYEVRNGSWCPYCSHHRFCIDVNCEHCTNKTLQNYNGRTRSGILKIDCWMKEKNGGLTPHDVTIGVANRKYWFQCDTCPHSFQLSPGSLTGRHTWCPYCCIPTKRLCGDKNCDHCFQRSFASFEGTTASGKRMVDCLLGDTPAHQICKASYFEHAFKCDCCNLVFKKQVNWITRGDTKGSWCGRCTSSKGEQCIRQALESRNIPFEERHSFPECKSTNALPFDAYIDRTIYTELSVDLVIEFDGIQHFQACPHFFHRTPGSFEDGQRRDRLKDAFCVEHKKLLLRISYKELPEVETWLERGLQLATEGRSGVLVSNEELYARAGVTGMVAIGADE